MLLFECIAYKYQYAYLVGRVNATIKCLLNLIILQLAVYTVLWKCRCGGRKKSRVRSQGIQIFKSWHLCAGDTVLLVIFILWFVLACLLPLGMFSATGSVCHLPRAVARRHLPVPRLSQEHWIGGAPCPRSFPRNVDSRSVHEARRERRRLDADVSAWVPGTFWSVGRRVRSTLREVIFWWLFSFFLFGMGVVLHFF